MHVEALVERYDIAIYQCCEACQKKMRNSDRIQFKGRGAGGNPSVYAAHRAVSDPSAQYLPPLLRPNDRSSDLDYLRYGIGAQFAQQTPQAPWNTSGSQQNLAPVLPKPSAKIFEILGLPLIPVQQPKEPPYAPGLSMLKSHTSLDRVKFSPMWKSHAKKMMSELESIEPGWWDTMQQEKKEVFRTYDANSEGIDITTTDGDSQRKRLVRIATRFAKYTVHSNIETLVLLCICRVLHCEGVPEIDLLHILFFRHHCQDFRSAQRLLAGIMLANKLLEALFWSGWGSEAVDLLSFCECSKLPLLRLAYHSSGARSRDRSSTRWEYLATESEECLAYFLNEFKEPKYRFKFVVRPGRAHSTLPAIVQHELKNHVAYDTCITFLHFSFR